VSKAIVRVCLPPNPKARISGLCLSRWEYHEVSSLSEYGVGRYQFHKILLHDVKIQRKFSSLFTLK